MANGNGRRLKTTKQSLAALHFDINTIIQWNKPSDEETNVSLKHFSLVAMWIEASFKLLCPHFFQHIFLLKWWTWTYCPYVSLYRWSKATALYLKLWIEQKPLCFEHDPVHNSFNFFFFFFFCKPLLQVFSCQSASATSAACPSWKAAVNMSTYTAAFLLCPQLDCTLTEFIQMMLGVCSEWCWNVFGSIL